MQSSAFARSFHGGSVGMRIGATTAAQSGVNAAIPTAGIWVPDLLRNPG